MPHVLTISTCVANTIYVLGVSSRPRVDEEAAGVVSRSEDDRPVSQATDVHERLGTIRQVLRPHPVDHVSRLSLSVVSVARASAGACDVITFVRLFVPSNFTFNVTT